MLTARRLRERREAAAAGLAPVVQPPPLTESEILRERFLAKQEAARAELRDRAQASIDSPAPVVAKPETKQDEGDRRDAKKRP